MDTGPGEAVPFLVLDCPYAAACQDQINHAHGAYVFTARKDWGDVPFRQDKYVFTDKFISSLHLGFGEAFNEASYILIAPFSSGRERNPQETRALVSPYRSWKIGTLYDDPTAPVDDLIPPDIFGLSPTTLEKQGTTIQLYVRTLDAPFESDVSVQVEANLPDNSTVGPFRLEKRRPEEPLGGQIHEGTLQLDQAGFTVLIFSATDEAGNLSVLLSSLVVNEEGQNTVAIGPTYLVETLEKSQDPGVETYRFGSIAARLFELVTSWYLDFQQ